jgi:hypothetical protein
LIFALDFISTTVDLIIMMTLPAHQSARKRARILKKKAMQNMQQQAVPEQRATAIEVDNSNGAAIEVEDTFSLIQKKLVRRSMDVNTMHHDRLL